MRWAALIHVGEVDFCQDAAAAIAAAVAAGLRPGVGAPEAFAVALGTLRPVSGDRMRALIDEALDLAGFSADYNEFRQVYQSGRRQWIMCDSRETVPAAFGLALLAGGDLVRGVGPRRISAGMPTLSPAWWVLFVGPFRGPRRCQRPGWPGWETRPWARRWGWPQTWPGRRGKAASYLEELGTVPGLVTGAGSD